MDPYKFSAIAHRDHDYCNPVSATRMDAILALVALSPASRVLDLGCGHAELAVRVAERWGARATAVDRSPPMLAAARTRVTRRGVVDTVTLVESDIAAFAADGASFDLAVMLGAGGIEGGVAGICASLAHWTRPGGYVLVGEGFWARRPDPEYAEMLGGAAALSDHRGNVQAGLDAGLAAVHAITATAEEWDDYEWKYARAIERHAREHPDDPDVPAMLERSRAWRDTYLRHGRGTLGFGCYLFWKP